MSRVILGLAYNRQNIVATSRIKGEGETHRKASFYIERVGTKTAVRRPLGFKCLAHHKLIITTDKDPPRHGATTPQLSYTALIQIFLSHNFYGFYETFNGLTPARAPDAPIPAPLPPKGKDPPGDTLGL